MSGDGGLRRARRERLPRDMRTLWGGDGWSHSLDCGGSFLEICQIVPFKYVQFIVYQFHHDKEKCVQRKSTHVHELVSHLGWGGQCGRRLAGGLAEELERGREEILS